ncbi:metallophosphoesterase [Bacteroides sp. 214]|uniref:metallophosphoesterase n=1 Tax=Bacteroides sp. 214 TaxID=2302935 RepID=UPI0013D7F38E|nr:metallophosphoesterase [Bacteroides sp. 214]NDW11751.1 metallophosphoesterase [Bacteroides sp. 214]
MRKLLLLFSVFYLLCSCATLNVSHPGIGRVKKLTFAHEDVPAAFGGFRLVFISDLHYPSLFTPKRLRQLVKTVNSLRADVLLLGGDYHNGCQYMPELFAALGTIRTTCGTVAVMGNHDTGVCYETILAQMESQQIRLLEQQLDTLYKDGEQIIIAGIKNPFDLQKNGVSPTLGLAPEDFVILLVHTPDYVEDVSVAGADLALAGHTHGGQVTLFGLYAPQTNSHYGQRFRTGMNRNSDGMSVYTTNGLGTSRKKIRMFAPTEVVLITLRQLRK